VLAVAALSAGSSPGLARAYQTGRWPFPAGPADRDWRPVWSDDFAGRARSLPGSGSWIVDVGRAYPGQQPGWGTSEVETYTDDPRNVSMDGRGNLVITAIRDAGDRWTSARIETRRADFQPPAGGSLKIEARISLPDGGPGYWPAFWALGSAFRPTHQILGAGEIDLLENIDNQSVVYGTLHCGTVSYGGPCHEDTGLAGQYLLPGPSGTAGFHTYAVVWSTSPAQLQWLIDGKPYWTVTPDMTGAGVWATALGHGYFLLLNLAIGGHWPGNPDAGTLSGRSMLIDYVSVARSSR
jgi:hypothetical protein